MLNQEKSNIIQKPFYLKHQNRIIILLCLGKVLTDHTKNSNQICISAELAQTFDFVQHYIQLFSLEYGKASEHHTEKVSQLAATER